MTANFTVRQFESPDADSVIDLWNTVLPRSKPWDESRHVICRKLNAHDGLFWVGERDGQVVATVIAGCDGVQGWIYGPVVAQQHRRQGLGCRMLQEAEKALLARGCTKFNLQVRGSDSEVIAFYERCAFRVENRTSLGMPLIISQKAIADPVPTIQVNEQISLSQITWDDKPSYLEHLNETDAFRANTRTIRFPYTETDAELWIWKAVHETTEAGGCRNWAIRNEKGKLIGGIGLIGMTPGEKAELGYWLAKPYWGQDITTEAVRRLCEFAFQQYGLRRIYAQALATNPASARVLAKVGFELEGTLRGHWYRDGRSYDVLFFGRMKPAQTDRR